MPEIIAWSNSKPAVKATPREVTKRWGFERIYVNGEPDVSDKQGNTYCMKVIHINKGQATSLHFHIDKHETLLVVQGKLTLSYNDGTGESGSLELGPGDAFIIPQGFQHRLYAQEDCDQDVILVEASTPDSPHDSIRVKL